MPSKTPQRLQQEKTINFMLTCGLAVAIAGALFKLMHWHSANQMLLSGMGSVAVAAAFKGILEGTLESIVTGCAIAVGVIAVLFRLMHWPGADMLLIVAIAGAIVWALVILKGKMGGEQEK
ncbi:MAG: hypothetical protein JWO06_2144 [Bacteroidota bacterium]|nr:hypothetical protein [Bacteroidota bacterium]